MFGQTELIYEFGPFRLDPANHLLLHNGEPVSLAPKSLDILLALVKNRGRVVGKDELIGMVWPDSFVEEINLTVRISMLRKALGDSPEKHRYIATVPRRGYRFVFPVSQAGYEEPSSSKLILSEPDRRDTKEIKSIAVLPFKYLGMDEKGEVLGASIADALISRLSSLKEIVVRPTTAVLKFKDFEQNPISAGRELDVDLVLDGMIQLAGGRVRLSVQLVRVSDSATLWAEKFDKDFTDIFAVQDHVSEQAALALELKLSGEEREQLTRSFTRNIEAYQLYIKGRYFWDKRTEKGLKRGIEYFQKAIEIDPDYALAYVGIGDSYTMLGEYLFLPPAEAFPPAKSAILRALEIDSTLAEAHITMAEIKMFYEWDSERSEKQFRQCLRMRPNYAAGRHSYAWLLMAMGQFHEAIAELRVAQEIDPYSLAINTALGLPYFYMREYDKAISAYRQTLEMNPDYILAHYYLGYALVQKGMLVEAIEEYKNLEDLEYMPQVLAMLAYTYSLSGKRCEALRILDELGKLSKQRYISPYNVAIIYAGLGEKDMAFQWLEKAFKERAAWMVFLKVDPVWDSLRANAEFKDITRRVGFSH